MTVLASDWSVAPHAALSLAGPGSGRGSVNSTICKEGRQAEAGRTEPAKIKTGSQQHFLWFQLKQGLFEKLKEFIVILFTGLVANRDNFE